MLQGPKGEKRQVLPRTLPSIPLTLSATSSILCASQSAKYRRIMAGEAPATLVEFAQQLLDWLRHSYPEASPTTLASIENQIRETWRRRHDMIHGGEL